MTRFAKKCIIIMLNNKPITVVFQSAPYAEMIKDELRTEHFESVFNVEISPASYELELEYEKEYTWSMVEIDYVTGDAAVKAAHKAMKEAVSEIE